MKEALSRCFIPEQGRNEKRGFMFSADYLINKKKKSKLLAQYQLL